jgi:hypothetical protein
MISEPRPIFTVYIRIIKGNPPLAQCFFRYVAAWFNFWKYEVLSMKWNFEIVGTCDSQLYNIHSLYGHSSHKSAMIS